MSKTNIGLVEYAKAQLGKPYWYGTFGQLSTPTLYSQKKKQYPKYYGWSYTSSELNKKVHDCVGLIKGYLWSDSPTDTTPTYKSSQDVSANGMLNICKEKGAISTMPDIPGILVFLPGHVGVYIGDGYVVEAHGHTKGVIKTALKGRGWKNWGKCPFITYEEVKKPITTTNSTTTTPTTNNSSPKVIATGVVNCYSLNFRNGAGTNNTKILKVLKKNTKVSIIGKQSNWYRVIVDGTTGYVKASYITWNGKVTGSTVNLRKGASTSNSVIVVLPKGTAVTVIDSTGSWYKIKATYKGKNYTGYMSATYIA